MNRLLLIPMFLLAGCLQHPLHQGNDLDPAVVSQIREGDSRFRVEKLMGTPVLSDPLHPDRAIYIEDFSDPDTDEEYRRKVVIEYDSSLHIKEITRTGFDTPDQP
ncbi:MAG: outer membrane protein assembly factor BamE [Mariprofundaceae bacterium]